MSIRKGQQITWGEEPGRVLEVLVTPGGRSTVRIEMEDGKRLLVLARELEEIQPKVQALTQPPPRSHKMLTGPDVSP